MFIPALIQRHKFELDLDRKPEYNYELHRRVWEWGDEDRRLESVNRNASHLQFSDRREMWRKKSARLCLFLSEAQRQKLKFACETENTEEGRKEMVVGTRKLTIPRVSDSASASQLIWAIFSPLFFMTHLSPKVLIKASPTSFVKTHIQTQKSKISSPFGQKIKIHLQQAKSKT